jgi:anti-anti-sigma factor
MEIKKKDFCGYSIYELRGEVEDRSMVMKIKGVVEKAIKSDKESIAIDLHSCDYINSELVGCFLGWKKQMDKQDKKFCLIEPNERAWDVFRATGLPDVISIYKNEVEFMQKVEPE